MLAFSIDTIAGSKLYQYGFEVTSAVAERIDGLKSLYRRGYRAYIPTAKGDLYIGMNKEHKYVLTPYESEADTLLFKEDNDLKNNKHYYALLVLEKGSTLGNVFLSQMEVRGVDIGNPMWGMHSVRETAGVADLTYVVKAFTTFFNL